jgi:hypothetical protein
MDELQRIKAICFDHEHCHDCPLFIRNIKYLYEAPRCVIWDEPQIWDIEKIKEIIEPKNTK